MAQNDKKFCLTLVSWELYLIWFWFLLPMLVLIQFFTLGHKKIGAQKIKTFYFQDKFYSLKAHVHYFTVLIYLPTSRAAKLLIVTHFTFTNLPWCSQSINSLIYVHSIQIPSCFLWVFDDSHDRTSSYYRHPKKKNIFLYYPLHMCQMMISPAIFFSFFQTSDFLGFSKFINKCQKEILRCALPSSHVCDFLPNQMKNKTYGYGCQKKYLHRNIENNYNKIYNSYFDCF